MYETIVIIALLWMLCNRESLEPAIVAVKQALSDDFKRDPMGFVFATVMMLVTLGMTSAFIVYGFWMMSK
jgi:hypothetical protein